jgi:hypothetical protein
MTKHVLTPMLIKKEFINSNSKISLKYGTTSSPPQKKKKIQLYGLSSEGITLGRKMSDLKFESTLNYQ